MGSENMKLPIIDFSHEDLKSGTLVWNQVKSQVHKALVEYGCFGATFDKIPIHLRNSIFQFSQEVFNLPLKTKVRNVSTKPFHGYVGQYPAVHFTKAWVLMMLTSLMKLRNSLKFFGQKETLLFGKTTLSYSEQLVELDQIVRRMILESLGGLEKYMNEHMNSINYILRLMKYKAPQSTETKLGLSAHTDKSIVTILCQNQVKGLQVLTKDGQWINVDPTPNTFTVIIGDSLHAWTNDRLHSPYQHPLLFKPFDHLKFLAFCYSKEGIGWEFPLKTYRGL
ncbi:hypothetical protein P3S67_009856 [Capsicum chacoense]